MKSLGLLTGYIAAILAANYVTTNYGMWPVGFGLSATAGTYLIGLLFILRDSLQDVAGKVAVFVAVTIGAIVSFAISSPEIAWASAAAFATAELVDFAIYTPLRKRGYVRAAVASNLVGSVVDTFVFLLIAAPFFTKVIPGFSIASSFPGQIVGKMVLTVAIVAAIAGYRAQRKLQAVAA
jgi:uncharacterized PurR-regulated membrane protein YhhQ (DUF165 family)